MGIAYRIQQFWRLLKVEPFPQEALPVVAAVLSPAELALFRKQAATDQTHGLRVLQTLQAAGETDSALLAAALLHDVGKCRLAPTIWDRVVGAFGERFFPQRAASWGEGNPNLLRRPFVIRFQHAAWGAEMAQRAGSRPLTVRLIRYHQGDGEELQNPEEIQLLARLKWADNRN